MTAKPPPPVTAEEALLHWGTHCLVDASLHLLTQHPLKHKGIAKFLRLSKEEKIQLHYQRNVTLQMPLTFPASSSQG